MIQAIETRYDGRLFRSRLEARWAVFFKTLGIQYEYEPEGYHLPPSDFEGDTYPQAIDYLPDFLIRKQKAFDQDTFIEVRPASLFTVQTHWALVRLSHGLGIRALHLPEVPDCDDAVNGFSDKLVYLEWPSPYPQTGDLQYCFCECLYCGCIGYEFDGRSARIDCGCPGNIGQDKNYNNASPRLVAAYNAARMARFDSPGRARRSNQSRSL